MNILDKIIEKKKELVTSARKKIPQASLEERIRQRTDTRPFLKRLKTSGPSGVNIIAEIKRASPSQGPIRPNLDPSTYARFYEKGGAACLSVLTDNPFFMGCVEDLIAARHATALPVLRKDFTVSSYQIYESAAMGADAVLLIARILTRNQLQSYLQLCRELNIDALVEIHTEEDLTHAAAANAALIGINNRNLSSFNTDTRTAIALSKRLGDKQIPVAASGIKTREDIEKNCRSGIWNFLIGESLVRANRPDKFLMELQGISLPECGEYP